MIKPLAIAGACIFGLGSGVARAEYPGTHWGESLYEVQQTFGADGYALRSPEGHSYLVVRTVAHRTAVIAFFFKDGVFAPRSAYGGLAEVAVAFPRAGEEIAKTIYPLPRENGDELLKTKRQVGRLLEEKYGAPTYVGTDQVWEMPDRTMVALKVREDLATIVYEPKDKDFDRYFGF
jgi:hypothetical protein